MTTTSRDRMCTVEAERDGVKIMIHETIYYCTEWTKAEENMFLNAVADIKEFTLKGGSKKWETKC